MVTKVSIVHRPPLYRVWQFFQALTARPLTRGEYQQVAAVLSPVQEKLFLRMRIHDQRHSFQVMQTIQELGQDHPDLLAAGLLHDVGKSRYALRIWEQPAVVLIRNFRPQTAVQWGNGRPKGWKRPFVVYQQHAEWGAEMAAAANSSPLSVELVRWHQSKLDDVEIQDQEMIALLRCLQEADSAN